MSALEGIISAEIEDHGPITFERFMELALYHPQWGYYSTPVEKIGRGGDFYTAPTVSPLFGAMVARQLEEMWRLAECPETWTLVEFGPGTGKLAGDIMSELSANYPAFYRAVTYYLVEVGTGLRERQQQALSGHAAAAKFNWVPDLAGIDTAGFEGCVLANELVDAFPVHLVQQREGRLAELYVDRDSNRGFRFVAGNPSTAKLEEYLAMQEVTLEEGQRAEINLRTADWLSETANHLRRGFILVIDYGTTTADLYGRHRFKGTLRSFHKHRLVDDPLLNPGVQDITAHVNFTALALQGRQAGLQPHGPVTQPQFLLNLGILDSLRGYDSFTFDPGMHKRAAAIKQLVLPGGMGDIFKVLVFSKGLEPAPPLTGLTGPQGVTK